MKKYKEEQQLIDLSQIINKLLKLTDDLESIDEETNSSTLKMEGEFANTISKKLSSFEEDIKWISIKIEKEFKNNLDTNKKDNI